MPIECRLFSMVMDRLTDEIKQEAPWTMMFADDILIGSESKEQLEEKLKSWRYALERRGMKVNRRKTEYKCVNERQDNGTVRMQGEEVAKVDGFKYLGSTVHCVQCNGECRREVKKRVQAGWDGWRSLENSVPARHISEGTSPCPYCLRPARLYSALPELQKTNKNYLNFFFFTKSNCCFCVFSQGCKNACRMLADLCPCFHRSPTKLCPDLVSFMCWIATEFWSFAL